PIDVNLTFARGVEPVGAGAAACDVMVRAYTRDDAEGALAVAGSAYRFSRFHLDPEVPNELAHRIKREWANNYVKGARGDRLFVAVDRGSIVGFLAALKS